MEDEKKTITEDTKAPPASKDAASLVSVGERGIVLRSLEDLLRFARMAVAAQVAPKGMTEGAAAIAIQAGLERGLGLLGGLQQAVVINGVLSWRGQGAYALIQNSPVCKPGTLTKFLEGTGDEMKGVAVAHRVGYAAPSRAEFSVKDAKLAGLWGKEGPWKQSPSRMLQWRALGYLARDVFPDVLGGFPLAEEAADYEVIAAPVRTGSVPSLPPPSAPDPLFDAISGAINITPKETVAVEAEEPPFESHIEADRELAAQEQGGLFSEATK